MPTILERIGQVERAVVPEYKGNGLHDDSWTAFYADDPRHDAQYTKVLGKRALLYARGFMFPAADMKVFEIRLYYEPTDLGYSAFRLQSQDYRDGSDYISSAIGIDKLLDGIESRPLQHDEIDEFYNIFTEQLCDLGGKNPVLRFLRSKTNPVWRGAAIKDALGQMRDEALRMNKQDWKRYERKLQGFFASKLVSEDLF